MTIKHQTPRGPCATVEDSITVPVLYSIGWLLNSTSTLRSTRLFSIPSRIADHTIIPESVHIIM